MGVVGWVGLRGSWGLCGVLVLVEIGGDGDGDEWGLGIGWDGMGWDGMGR